MLGRALSLLWAPGEGLLPPNYPRSSREHLMPPMQHIDTCMRNVSVLMPVKLCYNSQ